MGLEPTASSPTGVRDQREHTLPGFPPLARLLASQGTRRSARKPTQRVAQISKPAWLSDFLRIGSLLQRLLQPTMCP
jgi:hypothetical protein